MLKFRRQESVVEKKRFLKLIFLCFLVPIVIMAIATFIAYNNYKNLFETELKNNYISNLSALSENVDNSFNEIQSTTYLLSSDSNLYDIFFNNAELNIFDVDKINDMISTLIKFRSTKSLIDSVFVLHKASGKILDISGTTTVDNYFSRVSIYDKYPKDFWMNLKVKTSFYEILPNSILEGKGIDSQQKRNVIPLVTSNIDSVKTNNLLVVNISTSELANLLNKYKFVDSSRLFIMDHKGNIVSKTDNGITEDITSDKAFLNKIVDTSSNFFEYSYKGNKTLVISFISKSAKFDDFVYVAFVPYNDFYRKLTNIKTLGYAIIFFAFSLSIIIAYFMSRKIYSPINNLVEILSENSPESSRNNVGEIDYLNKQVKRILNNEDNLKKNLSIVMPLASEQYLTKILTNNDFLLDQNVKNFINNGHIKFDYSDFCVSIFELNFTEKYYNSYNQDDYFLVRKGIARLLEDIALGNYPTYVLSPNKNKLSVLINLPSDASLDSISESINNVLSLFNFDKDLVNITVGLGRIYSDYIGMNRSYNEALKALNAISPLSNEKIKIYSEIYTSSNYHFSINDENKLFNFLVGGLKQDAINFLNSLIEKNYRGTPSEDTLKKFYSDIYFTILRVLETKKVKAEELMKENYIDLNSDLYGLPINSISNYIFSMIEALFNTNKQVSKLDISQITDYIKQHYSEDLYLEKLSEIFNVSDKYLSKLFKDTLGTGFHEYLASFRISKSKALLTESDFSVTKIGELVGFSTHSTFFRIFKKFEGISPTQYRDSSKK